jgi:hypothetical protein
MQSPTAQSPSETLAESDLGQVAAEGCISVPAPPPAVPGGNLDRQFASQVVQRKEALDLCPRRLAMCRLRREMAVQHSREMQSSDTQAQIAEDSARNRSFKQVGEVYPAKCVG